LPSGNSSLVIHNSLIFNNTGYGILNYSSNTVDATRNWWGDPTGPYHYVLNTGGLGNAVSDGVNFSPWFNYDPTTQQPPIITNLQQFRLDEKVEMVEGESTANNLIIFESLLTDQNEENVKMQVELKEYNQFSPIEDRETLIRLAITYKPFWDIDNGLTLCAKCHKIVEGELKNV